MNHSKGVDVISRVLRKGFKEEDLAKYEKRKDGKLFKKWLQRRQEELNDANDKFH